MARQKKNKPQFRNGQYWGRHTVAIDGVKVRRWFPLGTDSEALANAKNRELSAAVARGELPSREETTAPETVLDAFTRLVEQQRANGMVTWKEREQRLRDYAAKHLEKLTVRVVRAHHIRLVLEACASLGKSKQTVTHLRNDLHSIFDQLWRDDLIPENPVLKVKIPKMAPSDTRARQILTEDEFITFVTCEKISLRLRTMAVVSRVLGGLRTSDLHAWSWEHIDTKSWKTAQIRRPKTKGMAFLELPEWLCTWLQRWHAGLGLPATGPVFPVGRGLRANERRGHLSYAHALRKALKTAGITRAELYADNELSRQVDFHSFRRAYTTALADTGVNAQTSMRLAGHTKLETHLRYVDRLNPIKTPDGVLSLPARRRLEGDATSEPKTSRRDRDRTDDIRRVKATAKRFFRLFGPAMRGYVRKERWVSWSLPSPRRFETKLKRVQK